jgi:hypothetical protein
MGVTDRKGMMVGRPLEGEFAPFYAGYVSLVPEHNIASVLEEQADEVSERMGGFIPNREQFRYAPGKWTVRQVLGHMADAERVFGFRAFCFSRGDENPLPGFDENEYVARSIFEDVPLADLVGEFRHIRQANLIVLRRLDEEGWRRIGNASGHPVSVRALAYIMAGHVRHHLEILRTRYTAV